MSGLRLRARRLLVLAERYQGRRRLATVFVLQWAAALSEGVGLALLVPAFGLATGSEQIQVPGLGWQLSPALTIGLVAVAILGRALLTMQAQVRATQVRLEVTDALRRELLEATLHAQWRFITSRHRSDLVQHLTSQVSRVGLAIDGISKLVIAAWMACMIAAAAVVISPAVGLSAIVAVTVMSLAARGTVATARRLGSQLTGRALSYGRQLSGSLDSIEVVRAHDAAGPWLNTVSRQADEGRAVQLEFARRTARVQFVLTALGVTGLVVLLLVARELGLASATLFALAVATSRLLNTAQGLISQSQQFAHSSAAIDDLTDYLSEARAHAETEPSATDYLPLGRAPEITLDAVTIGYGEAPVLQDLSARLPVGGTTVILGPSGAGKSTLVALLLGLLTPDAGRVLVDALPLRAPSEWRARCGFVPQETTLVSGSVRENLTWTVQRGRVVSDEDLWAALRVAALESVIRALPQGLETDLGDFTRLSGGERQRLCIARALVRQPDVLILDEATSALDPATEEAVLGAVLGTGLTVVLVTHREHLADRADLVMRLART